jgi:hypothetical protein
MKQQYMHQMDLEKHNKIISLKNKNYFDLPSARRFTVHTAFGLPGNSETAISVT